MARTDLRREEIAAATLAIIASHGVRGVTVRRVAAAVGISAAALYRHYINKTEILYDAMENHLHGIFKHIRKAKNNERGPLEGLKNIYYAITNPTKQHCGLAILYASDYLWSAEPKLRTLKMYHSMALREAFISIIKKAQAIGEIRRDIRAEEIVVHFLSIIVFPPIIKARTLDAMDMVSQLATSWQLFLHAVSPGIPAGPSRASSPRPNTWPGAAARDGPKRSPKR